MPPLPHPEDHPAPRSGAAAEAGDGLRPCLVRIDSRTLFAGHSELLIAHGCEDYRLRITRQGKLLLTK